MPRRMPSKKMDLLLMEGIFKLNLQVIKSFLYSVFFFFFFFFSGGPFYIFLFFFFFFFIVYISVHLCVT